MSEALTKQETVRGLLSRPEYRSRFDEVLGDKAPGFIASVIAISHQKELAKCEPRSVLASAMTAAILDLPIDKNLGLAWIVPYGNVAQFQVGWKGFVQLSLRSGQFEKLNARGINAECLSGYDEVGQPVIDWSKLDDSKDVVGYVVAWKLTNGHIHVGYWPTARVEKHGKRYSKAFGSGPWQTHRDEMCLKTCVKNELNRWAPKSIEMVKAIQHDQGTQKDIDAEVIYPDSAMAVEIEKPSFLEAEGKVDPAPPPATPEPTPTTPEKEPPKWVQLESIVNGAGYTFDEFVRWAKSIGQIDNKLEPIDFSEIPEPVVKTCLRSEKGMLTGLAKTKGKSCN